MGDSLEPLLDGIEAGVFAHQPVGPDARGTFELANETFCRLLGCSREEAARLSLPDVVDARELSALAEDFRLLQRERALRRRRTLVASDGRRVRVEIASRLVERDGRPVVVSLVHEEGAGAQEPGSGPTAPEAASASPAAALREVLAALPLLAWTCDARGGRAQLGPQWAGYAGPAAQEASENGWLRFVHPDDRERGEQEWSRALLCGTPLDTRLRLVAADGTSRAFRVRAVPLRDASGPRAWLGTAEDVEDAARARDALREAEQRREEFLAILSHELRNPLAPIRNGLFILDRAAPGSGQARRARDIVERQVVQLARIVDDLLDVTRITRNRIELQRQPLDLGELVARTFEDHRPLFADRGVIARLEPAPGPLPVSADAMRLSQAVANLLSNAARFTGSGGTATVSACEDAARGEAVVRVRDTGIGMPRALVARLFEPFAQADTSLERPRGGIGIGLALVKGIVDLHGGSVTGRSDGEGLGSEFELRLPLDRAAATAAGAERPRTAPRRRVLIVEDNHDAADSLREALELEGHEVEVAYEGRTGIARALAMRPDLVLCDIGLPGVDGYEIARILRAEPSLSAACLVALTGYALPDDVRRAAEAGFHFHLAKPPSIEKLQSLLR